MLSAKVKYHSSNRGTYAIRLAAAWVRLNRPDVWKACFEEATNKFPMKTRLRNKIILPPSLAGITAFQPKDGKKS